MSGFPTVCTTVTLITDTDEITNTEGYASELNNQLAIRRKNIPDDPVTEVVASNREKGVVMSGPVVGYKTGIVNACYSIIYEVNNTK